MSAVPLEYAMNFSLHTQRSKEPGAAFAKMVTELETGRHKESELTQEIFKARLTSAHSGAGDHGPETRSLLARLFPLDARRSDLTRGH